MSRNDIILYSSIVLSFVLLVVSVKYQGFAYGVVIFMASYAYIKSIFGKTELSIEVDGVEDDNGNIRINKIKFIKEK